jgi:hypothetical protein
MGRTLFSFNIGINADSQRSVPIRNVRSDMIAMKSQWTTAGYQATGNTLYVQ